ncbi:hypothetical protein HK57_00054 [Aspergillus ustus]|uniref:Uncharacterized protein n=1 Tax=Aspergillus ustus TaxID=40382 RepID=A0A0C1C367_ASPUT|nr:hypothetical protein HK57_00054 [Aspergillus ustus]
MSAHAKTTLRAKREKRREKPNRLGFKLQDIVSALHISRVQLSALAAGPSSDFGIRCLQRSGKDDTRGTASLRLDIDISRGGNPKPLISALSSGWDTRKILGLEYSSLEDITLEDLSNGQTTLVFSDFDNKLFTNELDKTKLTFSPSRKFKDANQGRVITNFSYSGRRMNVALRELRKVAQQEFLIKA